MNSFTQKFPGLIRSWYIFGGIAHTALFVATVYMCITGPWEIKGNVLFVSGVLLLVFGGNAVMCFVKAGLVGVIWELLSGR